MRATTRDCPRVLRCTQFGTINRVDGIVSRWEENTHNNVFLRPQTHMEEDKKMAKTTSKQASAPPPQETKKQLKKQAKKEAKTMLLLAQAQKDAKKAELKVARAQAQLEASMTHTHTLETRLEELRNHSQQPVPVKGPTHPVEPGGVAESNESSSVTPEQEATPQAATAEPTAEPIAKGQLDASGVETLGHQEPAPSVVEENETVNRPSGMAKTPFSAAEEGSSQTNGHVKTTATTKPVVTGQKSATKPAATTKKPTAASEKSASKPGATARKPPVRSTARRTPTPTPASSSASTQTPAQKPED